MLLKSLPMEQGGHAVVVSWYAARPQDDLLRLLAELRPLTPHVLVVVNQDGVGSPFRTTVAGDVPALVRPNVGMNIGAWQAGLELLPGRDHYVFLQDECEILSPAFPQVYVDALGPGRAGMLGEAFNTKWDRPWPEIAGSALDYDLDPAVYGVDKRVGYYLACMRRWGIDPGDSGTHLQSLVWAFDRATLEAIGGFPLGRDKEECIAAEIAVSRAVAQRGIRFGQADEQRFRYVYHKEWRRDGPGKIGRRGA